MHISVWGGKRTVRVELVDDDGEVRQIEAADLRALVQLLGPAVLLLGRCLHTPGANDADRPEARYRR